MATILASPLLLLFLKSLTLGTPAACQENIQEEPMRN